MTRPPIMAGAAKPKVTAPAAGLPTDLCSLVDAARAVDVTPPTVRYWVETGKILEYGRGPGGERFVSLAEVKAFATRPRRPSGAEYPDDLISAAEAAELLGCSLTKIRKQAKRGEINVGVGRLGLVLKRRSLRG